LSEDFPPRLRSDEEVFDKVVKKSKELQKLEPDWAKYRRVFGTLAYLKVEPKTKIRKGDAKYSPGVFVGQDPQRSAWIILHPVKTNARKDGWKYALTSTRTAKFTDLFVNNVDSLKNDRVEVTRDLHERLKEETFENPNSTEDKATSNREPEKGSEESGLKEVPGYLLASVLVHVGK
jgi:hypothetical protein